MVGNLVFPAKKAQGAGKLLVPLLFGVTINAPRLGVSEKLLILMIHLKVKLDTE